MHRLIVKAMHKKKRDIFLKKNFFSQKNTYFFDLFLKVNPMHILIVKAMHKNNMHRLIVKAMHKKKRDIFKKKTFFLRKIHIFLIYF